MNRRANCMIFFCGNQKSIIDVLRLGKTLSKDKDNPNEYEWFFVIRGIERPKLLMFSYFTSSLDEVYKE